MNRDDQPTRSSLKSRRLSEPTDHVVRAYMKQMREYNITRKIYEIDPYVEVYQFRENLYGLFSHNADGFADVWMYLIIGLEKALLIDTSFGIGDLKSLVQLLTGGMPVILANTHPSYDHSFGNCQFERAYFHEYARPQNEKQFRPQMWDYLFDDNGKGKWLEFDRSDIIAYHEYEVVYVPNGHTFNLGGDFEVELVWLPGHHAGHCGFLDKKDRIFVAGDVLCAGGINIGRGFRQDEVYGQYCTVTALRDQFEKLVSRLDEFDYIFPGHGVCDLDKGIVPLILAALNEIIAQPDNFAFETVLQQASGIAFHMRHKFVRGLGAVVRYTSEGV